MSELLFVERYFNLLLSGLALLLILARSRAAVQEFHRQRIARYFAYVGLVFWSFEGNLESIATGAPTGVKTVLGTAILLFVIYSEWPEGHSRKG